MTENASNGPLFGRIPKELLAASAGGLVGLIGQTVLNYSWNYFGAGEPPEWAQANLPNVIGAVLLGAFVTLGSRIVVAWRARRLRKTAKAKGDRLAIYVARLDGDDENATLRRSVIDTIRQELGRKAVEIIPAGITLRLKEDVSDDLAALGAQKEAQKLLRSKGGHVLVWGRIHRHGGKSIVELRFSSGTYGSEGSRFGITEKLLLEQDFLAQIGGALAGVVIVAAVPAIFQPGKFFAQTLVTAADRGDVPLDVEKRKKTLPA